LTAARVATKESAHVTGYGPQRREEMAVDKVSIMVKPSLIVREDRKSTHAAQE